MKKSLSYLFAGLGLFAFTACGGGSSENTINKEVMVCANTGAPCLEDHSCCFINKEEEVADEESQSDK